MPTVVFISPKGGVGKTTAALLLASEIARGAPVTVIDADPNRPIQAWGKGAELSENLAIVADVDKGSILDRIEEVAAQTPFVIIDLEGTAAKIVLRAVSQADLVIIPSPPRQQRRHVTGRNRQINIKATEETIAALYRFADDLELPLDAVLERALATLEEQGGGD